MIGVWAEILTKLLGVGRQLDFELDEDSDFIARLTRADGWQIVLEGDRASYPAFTLNIARTGETGIARSYALWLLMKNFSPLLDPERLLPTLENQLWFLEGFAERLFDDEERYRAEYAQLEIGLT